MSLPTPTTSKHGIPALSPQQQQQLDAPLVALAQRCNGDLRIIFHAFFSFLHRRTDFYCLHNQLDVQHGNQVQMGFREGDAEKLLLAAFKQFPLRRMPPSNSHSMKRNGPSAPSAATATAMATATAPSSVASNSRKEKGKDPNQNAAIPPHATAKPSNPIIHNQTKVEPKIESDVDASKKASNDADAANVDAKHDDTKEKEQNLDHVRYTKDGNQIPVGNGGTTKQYKWTQTLDEITIALPLPKLKNSNTIRARDLDVQIKRSSISVQFKDDTTTSNAILNGELLDKIKKDDSTWSIEIESGDDSASAPSVLLIILEKTSKRWWNRVLVDESETIDIDLVDKTHTIDNYDEATQGMIRRIIFDEKQERLGLPSSDEIEFEGEFERRHGKDGAGVDASVRESTEKNFPRDKGVKMATSSTLKRADGGELKELPPGVEFIDKHNFPGGNK